MNSLTDDPASAQNMADRKAALSETKNKLEHLTSEVKHNSLRNSLALLQYSLIVSVEPETGRRREQQLAAEGSESGDHVAGSSLSAVPQNLHEQKR